MPRLEFSDDVGQLATRIPRRLHKAVKLAAFTDDVTVRHWVADALAAHLRACQGDETAAPRAPATLPRRARGAA